MEIGYVIAAEEQDPLDLVRDARRAEEAGFDYLSVTDHYHPWIREQGQSSFVWSLLGAIASATSTIRVGTGVTCPTIRIHPAVIAQAAATTARLFQGRFFFGVGTGENLNEHILGGRWPPVNVRLEMLEEALDVIRALWSGRLVDHRGRHYTVENAQLFTLPDEPPPVLVSALGPKAAEVAARVGEGYWGTGPKAELVEVYETAGGTGPRCGQLNLCWARNTATARRIAHRLWPNPGFPGQISRELAMPQHYEQLASEVSEDRVAATTPCGPDPEPIVEKARAYRDGGFTHIHLHQVGPDQEGFLRFWESELAPALRAL